MGLLDALSSDDAKLGIALLSASGYSPTPMSFGQRLGGALQQVQADKASALKLKLLQSQMDENASQDLLRRAQIGKLTSDQAFMDNIGKRLNGVGGVPAAGGGVPGGAATGPSGMGGGMGAPGIAGTSPVGANAFPLTFGETVMAGLRGHDLLPAYKYANEPEELKPGSLYRNRMSGQTESIPSMSQNGQASQIVADPNAPGGYRVIVPVGAPEAYKTYKDIDANVASGNKLTKVYNNATKQDEYLTDAEIIARRRDQQGQGGGNASPAPMGRPGTAANMRGGFTGTPDEIMGAINSYPEPVRSQMRQAYVNQTTGNNPAFDAMGTGALPPATEPGARPTYAAGPSAQDQTSAKFNDTMAAKQGEQLDKSYTAANDASSALAGIRESRKAMQAGAYQGTGADFKLGVMKFTQALGVNIDPEKVANTDYLKSTLGNALLEKAKTLGSNPSNADASRITDIVGSIGKDPQAMSKILDWQEEMAMKSINGHNTRVGQAESNGFKSQFDLRVPIPEKAGTSPAKQQTLSELPKTAVKGARVRDTTTGKILRFNGLQWKEE